MYAFKKDQMCKFAKFQCPECKQIVIGHIKEFIGSFETYINRADEMFFTNDLEYRVDDSGVFYKGLCPNCGKHVHASNVKYLYLDFNKF